MKYSAISAVPLAVLAAYQANAQVTVYTGIPSRTATADPAEATVDYAGLVSLALTPILDSTSNLDVPPYDHAQIESVLMKTRLFTHQPAYDPLTLEPPAPPETPVTSYGLTVPSTEDALIAAGRQLSIQQKGSFLGFSIELSVAPSISEFPSSIRRPERPYTVLHTPLLSCFTDHDGSCCTRFATQLDNTRTVSKSPSSITWPTSEIEPDTVPWSGSEETRKNLRRCIRKGRTMGR